MTAEPTHYRLTVRPLPDAAPPAVRLRRWLKTGLRRDRLRCVKVEEVSLPPPGSDSSAAGKPPQEDADG